MQAVYYPSKVIEVRNGDEVKVVSNHSEYNLWFDVIKRYNVNNFISSNMFKFLLTLINQILKSSKMAYY